MHDQRISIKDLIDGGDTKGKCVGGKVVQKSGVRSYKTKGKKKFFFYLGVADETDCIKVMVYGKENFQKFQEGCSYNFRDVLVDKFGGESIIKFIFSSKISKIKEIQVSKTLELQAQMLIYSQSPVYSIDTIQSLDEKTAVSVEGTVTEVRDVHLNTFRTSELWLSLFLLHFTLKMFLVLLYSFIGFIRSSQKKR